MNKSIDATIEDYRTRKANSYLEDLLDAARRVHEQVAALRVAPHRLIDSNDDLTLQLKFIAALANKVAQGANDLVVKIESGELDAEVFNILKNKLSK